MSLVGDQQRWVMCWAGTVQLRGALAAGMAFSRDLSLPCACSWLPGATPTGISFSFCHMAVGEAEVEIIALAKSFACLQELFLKCDCRQCCRVKSTYDLRALAKIN